MGITPSSQSMKGTQGAFLEGSMLVAEARTLWQSSTSP